MQHRSFRAGHVNPRLLQRVLASETFSKAHSLRRLLAYVVDETMAGRAATLKEYPIGGEGFDRGDGWSRSIRAWGSLSGNGIIAVER